jgi:hypothetical protein
VNAKTCKKLRAAFRVWDASEQAWTLNRPAYKKAKKKEEKRIAAECGGQKPKIVAVRQRKPKAAVKPTWPASPDQRAQSRPVIVLKSRKCTHKDHRCDEIRHAWPKHVLDCIALCNPVGVA